jgi:hypothetical protein
MRLITERTDPRPIAIVRIALGVAVVSNALETSVVLQRVVDGRIRVPVLESLPAPTSFAVQLCAALGVLAGVALAVGFFAAPAAIAATALNLWVFLWDQQTYSNHRVLVTLLVAYLVFAESDTRWAVRRRSPQAATVRWWPQLLMMTQISTCYFFAAVNKMNPAFLAGDMFETWLRWPLPDRLYPLMAVATVLTELFLAVGLWLRQTRVIAAAVGVALHVSIVVGMAEQTVPLTAFALACVPVYSLFLTRPSFSLKAAIAPSPADVVVR